MGYDWKKHDRELEQRLARSALWLGLTMVVLAVVGIVAMLLTRSLDRLIRPGRKPLPATSSLSQRTD
ncbi:hypothetical protein [Microlunatus speluncae]|uniref:hypothetical protein n=1 Tax=Microlunatus speluncae TaxID=2594267 RepID=UPI0012662356|nr:hypothetical protein [Microlunatus speluncae]